MTSTVGTDTVTDNVWTPELADNPGTEKDLPGDNAVIGGVVTGRSVEASDSDPSPFGALF